MAPTCLKELQERFFSLSCTSVINLFVMYDQPYLCHARSIFSRSCTISLLSVMYDQPSLVMYDQPSLCHVRSTFSRHVRSAFSRHVRSALSESEPEYLLSQYKFTSKFCWRCIVSYSAPPVAAELRPLPLPLICHVRSTFFLSCTNNLISVMYEQPYHVRSSLSLPLRSTWLTEGK